MADAIADLYNIWSLEIEALYARARDAHAGDAADRGVSDSSSAHSQQDALEVQYNRLTTSYASVATALPNPDVRNF